MTQPRSFYVDPDTPRLYHISSRCVRRCWLLGTDPHTGTNYDHRKDILLNRIKHLSRFFAIKIYAYAIMSNHFHIVLEYNPTEKYSWSDEEVARRWCAAFNGRNIVDCLNGPTQLEHFDLHQTIRYHNILSDPHAIEKCRKQLGDLSDFMKYLKQPFSVWINHEDGCKGTAFEKRFYSGALLTEEDVMACMAYVDLNPVQAKMVDSLKASTHTSIHERLTQARFNPDKLDAFLAPLWEEDPTTQLSPTDKDKTHSESEEASPYQPVDAPHKPAHDRYSALPLRPCTLKVYVTQLNLGIVYTSHPQAAVSDQFTSWMARLFNRERTKRSQDPAFFEY